MLKRVLEPEVMDTAREAADYDAMDHAEVNRRFVDDLLSAHSSEWTPGDVVVRCLDVGTGTARIPIELCRRAPEWRVVGIDLANEMLSFGRRNVADAGLDDHIELQRVDGKALTFADGAFDAVISNSIAHHIPAPAQAFAEMLRVLKPGGLLFVRDLLRPATNEEVEYLVATHTGSESPTQQQLFRQSLQAALTAAEVADMIASLGLPRESVQQTSDRHWTLAARKANLGDVRGVATTP